MTLTDYMCQEKKEKEDLPALKTEVVASVQRLEEYIQKHRERLITGGQGASYLSQKH